MAVDPNIKKKADDIRNKVYGKEVRESLASGLEEMSSDVVENESRQSVVEGRQDSVESQWQAVSDEMTDKDVISAPEIIAARNGEANLKARLDKENQEVNAQLAQTDQNLKERGINIKSPPSPYVGAKGDGVTDDYKALQDIIDYVASQGDYHTVYFPKSNGYVINDTLSIPRNMHVIMDDHIIYKGSMSSPAMIIGEPGMHNYRVKLDLSIISHELSDWLDDRNTGALIYNAYSANIRINNVQKFTVGVDFRADAGGFTMSHIDLNYISDNKIGVQVSGINNGWPNANSFYGGFFYRFGATHQGKESISIRITSLDNSYANINSNIFHDPRFEAKKDNIPFFFHNANNNKILNLRAESNSDEKLGHLVNSRRNEFTSVAVISQSNKIISEEQIGTYLNEVRTPIFSMGNLGKFAESDDVSVTFHDDVNLEMLGSDGTVKKRSTSFTTNENKDIVTRFGAEGISFLVQSKDVKKFFITINSSELLRLGIVPYDKEGNKLLGNVPEERNVNWKNSLYARSLFSLYENMMGGMLRVGSAEPGYSFEVHEDVAYFRLVIQSQTAETILYGFTLSQVTREDSRTSYVYTEL